MNGLLDIALWRPLSAYDPQPNIVPTVLIYHTMVGYLLGTESYFKTGNGAGYLGTESTFGVGGVHDGQYDGVIFQWQTLLKSADAQFAGNAYANSVETSDGGNPAEPWSPKQLEALINLGVVWCHTTGVEPVLAHKAADGKIYGIGYHQQFPEWNLSGHDCPGSERRQQLLDVVLPEIQKRYAAVPAPAPAPAPAPKPAPTPAPAPAPKPIPAPIHLPPAKPTPGKPVVPVSVVPAFPLPLNHWYGEPSPDPRNHSGFYSASDRVGIARFQQQLRARGWTISVDGKFGKQTGDVVEQFQREKGLAADRKVGPVTWHAFWAAPVT